jgi:hypothetical protein
MSVWRGRRVRLLVGRLEVGLDWWLRMSSRWHCTIGSTRASWASLYRVADVSEMEFSKNTSLSGILGLDRINVLGNGQYHIGSHES